MPPDPRTELRAHLLTRCNTLSLPAHRKLHESLLAGYAPVAAAVSTTASSLDAAPRLSVATSQHTLVAPNAFLARNVLVPSLPILLAESSRALPLQTCAPHPSPRPKQMPTPTRMPAVCMCRTCTCTAQVRQATGRFARSRRAAAPCHATGPSRAAPLPTPPHSADPTVAFTYIHTHTYTHASEQASTTAPANPAQPTYTQLGTPFTRWALAVFAAPQPPPFPRPQPPPRRRTATPPHAIHRLHDVSPSTLTRCSTGTCAGSCTAPRICCRPPR